MRRIQSTISTSSAEFRRNEAHNRGLVAAFRSKQEAARHSRPARGSRSRRFHSTRA